MYTQMSPSLANFPHNFGDFQNKMLSLLIACVSLFTMYTQMSPSLANFPHNFGDFQNKMLSLLIA